MFEQIINFIFTYVLMFWVVLFCVLPIGVKTEENPQQGNDHGAPTNISIKKKFLITAIITLIMAVLYTYLSSHGIFSWEELGK